MPEADAPSPALFAEFQRNLSRLLECEVIAEPHWEARCRQIVDEARNGNSHEFLRWRSLEDISVSEIYPDIFAWHYEKLLCGGQWNEKWHSLSREIPLGKPKVFSGDKGTSPILIQHTYHLYLYETLTGRPFYNCDIIVELGGGFGSMCRLVRNAGFRGLYIIFDLPPLSEVQRLYLNSLSHTEATRRDILTAPQDKYWLVNYHEIDLLCDYLGNTKCDSACIATWSLSEFPLQLRNRFFPRLHQSLSRYLITFEGSWRGIDNSAYFGEFTAQRRDCAWHSYAIPGSEYLLL